MIELDRHIEILLLSNDCVIVPGLGGFMTHHVNAYYEESENLFLPPMRTLGFNAQLTINDSLLAQSYIEAYDISFPEAIRRIEQEVAELKEWILTKGEYELTDIGVLSLNADGKYEFKPCEAGILTPSLYGLGSFEMKKMSTIAPVLNEETTDQTTIKSKKNTEHRSPVLPMMTLEKEPDKDKKAVHSHASADKITINVQLIRNAVAVAAAILCFFIFTLPLGNSSINNVTESSIHNGMIHALLSESPKQTIRKMQRATDTVSRQTVARDTIGKKQAADAMVKETTKPEKMSAKDVRTYCLVLASHVTIHNAEIFVDQLHEEGYHEARLMKKGKMVRVVYGSYNKKDNAFSELNKLHEHEHFEQAWVLEI